MSDILDELIEKADEQQALAHTFRMKLRSNEISQEDISSFLDIVSQYCEGEIYQGYSGLGMYGKRCWGIKGDLVSILETAGLFGLTNASYDSLGRTDHIVYWEYLKSE